MGRGGDVFTFGSCFFVGAGERQIMFLGWIKGKVVFLHFEHQLTLTSVCQDDLLEPVP